MEAETLARSATQDSSPPAGLSAELTVLWLARAGRWDQAHDACQDLPDPAGAWIHAWLHREEGDQGIAAYCDSRARKPVPPRGLSLSDEWMEIAKELAR
jgi:hypothetical protein